MYMIRKIVINPWGNYSARPPPSPLSARGGGIATAQHSAHQEVMPWDTRDEQTEKRLPAGGLNASMELGTHIRNSKAAFREGYGGPGFDLWVQSRYGYFIL